MKFGTKKDHNVEMCILQGECCFFKGVRALGLRIFYAKYMYFVFATPP